MVLAEKWLIETGKKLFVNGLRLYAVRDCGLLSCPPTPKFERGRMLELLRRSQKLQFVPAEKSDIQAIIEKQKGPETRLERLERLTGINPCICPVRKTGCMVIIRELSKIRSPSLLAQKQPQHQT